MCPALGQQGGGGVNLKVTLSVNLKVTLAVNLKVTLEVNLTHCFMASGSKLEADW